MMTPVSTSSRAPLVRIVLAAIIASAALVLQNEQRIDVENFALGSENRAAFEHTSDKGLRITAASIPDIASLIENLAKSQTAAREKTSNLVLWLGNSQLHTINRHQSGDHLAPYWLYALSNCAGCMTPIGISLPNANIQEHFVLAHVFSEKLPLSAIVLALVYDDLREDGLRDDFDKLLTAQTEAKLVSSKVGRDIVNMWRARTKGAALNGFGQQRIENSLVESLARVSPLWADRGHLRSHVLIHLYDLRNWLFGIKPTTVRTMIEPRYERNMRTLDEMLNSFASNGIPTLIYIAPIRQDAPLPYDAALYKKWKEDVENLARARGTGFMNLERLVPADQWGSYRNDDIDFMHFQGNGHVLLAKALLPEVRRLIANRSSR